MLSETFGAGVKVNIEHIFNFWSIFIKQHHVWTCKNLDFCINLGQKYTFRNTSIPDVNILYPEFQNFESKTKLFSNEYTKNSVRYSNER